MKEIPLSKGKAFALVDDDDYDWLMGSGPWQFSNGRYARRFDYWTGKRTIIWMHRAVLNLRISTQQQNVWNTKRQSRGGFFHWQTGRFRSQLRHCGKKLDVGFFDTQEEAEAAHAFCAYYLRGEFGTYQKPPDFDTGKLGPSMRARIESAKSDGTTNGDRE